MELDSYAILWFCLSSPSSEECSPPGRRFAIAGVFTPGPPEGDCLRACLNFQKKTDRKLRITTGSKEYARYLPTFGISKSSCQIATSAAAAQTVIFPSDAEPPRRARNAPKKSKPVLRIETAVATPATKAAI